MCRGIPMAILDQKLIAAAQQVAIPLLEVKVGGRRAVNQSSIRVCCLKKENTFKSGKKRQ